MRQNSRRTKFQLDSGSALSSSRLTGRKRRRQRERERERDGGGVGESEEEAVRWDITSDRVHRAADRGLCVKLE